MSSNEEYQLPPTSIWPQIAKLAINEDKPLMLDYWVDSLEKKVIIGVKEDEEKLLVKNSEEYTSPITKIFQLQNIYIIVTENSIYITANNIDKRRISS